MAAMGADLYDRDFYSWTQNQAEALRRAATDRVNLPLDWTNLAEEIDSLGRSQLSALHNELALVIEHLLKLEYSPAIEPRNNWLLAVGRHQQTALDLWTDNPGLRQRVDLGKAFRIGRRNAVDSLRLMDRLDPSAVPLVSPYALADLLERDWAAGVAG
jgi:hypothetical protein